MEIKAVKLRKDGFYSQPFVFGGEEGAEKFDKNIRYRGSLQNYVIDTGKEVILVDTGLPAGFPEGAPDELKDIPNIVPVEFTDGAYYNFPESQKIADGVYYIKAKGHTNGNSLIIAENEGLFYLFEGDITYVDEALYANKLSVVFDDLPAARETMDRVREFIRKQPTVYCGTHTPQGYENLEAKRVMDLDNPVPTVLAEIDFSQKEDSGKYLCSVCGYLYDPAEHDGVAFEDLPDDWRCPRCKQGKEKFNKA